MILIVAKHFFNPPKMTRRQLQQHKINHFCSSNGEENMVVQNAIEFGVFRKAFWPTPFMPVTRSNLAIQECNIG